MPPSKTTRKVSITFDRPGSRKVSVLAGDAYVAELARQSAQEDEKKLLELSKIFEISPGPNQWFYLALALAREHYPTPVKRGIKNKWNPTLRAILVADVERMRSRKGGKGHSVAWACGRLAVQEPWKTLAAMKGTVQSLEPAESLRRAYHDGLKDRSTGTIREVISRWPPMTDTEWSEWITHLVKDF